MTQQAIVVSSAEAGRTLAAVVKSHLRLSWTQARALIAAKRVLIGRQPCGDAIRRLKSGERIAIVEPRERSRKPKKREAATRRPAPRNSIAIVYCDDEIVVVEKPPGLTTVRHESEAREFGVNKKKYLPTTLADLLPSASPGLGPVRAVHRLDRDTSGLLVFARTEAAERAMGRQFRAHTIARSYLAVVRGRPAAGPIESWLVRDRGDGRRGSGPSGQGQRAVTHVELREELGACSLIACRLETGRTHQVRIHLGEAGAPLAGERIYDRPINGSPIADPSGSPRIALHAEFLGLKHPTTGEWMEWRSPLPEDLSAVVRRLRGSKRIC